LGVSACIALCVQALTPIVAFAHAMAPGDKGFIMCSFGAMVGPFAYLGAKHMVTGVDHILFLLAVVFFLFRLKEIGLYVTLFAVGHSITLLLGVLSGIQVNPFAIDAIIGFSVVYKALDNLGWFQTWFGTRPNLKVATLVFGLFHGMGLATKMLEFEVSGEGLVANLIAFNVGVEVGQVLALSTMLVALRWWRRTDGFHRQAAFANVGIMIAGLVLIGYQISGFIHARTV
jgi:hypothetical protein